MLALRVFECLNKTENHVISLQVTGPGLWTLSPSQRGWNEQSTDRTAKSVGSVQAGDVPRDVTVDALLAECVQTWESLRFLEQFQTDCTRDVFCRRLKD